MHFFVVRGVRRLSCVFVSAVMQNFMEREHVQSYQCCSDVQEEMVNGCA